MYVSERTDKDVLEALRHYVAAYHRFQVSAQEIADFLGCSRSTVVRSIERLEQSGKIERISARPNGYKLADERSAAYAW